MLGQTFRPSGDASWLLPKLAIDDWLVIGSISSEDRCLSILHHFSKDNSLVLASFLNIKDPGNTLFEYEDQSTKLREQNAAQFVKMTKGKGKITDFGLLDSPLLIKNFAISTLEDNHKNIILDTSSLPKRFFFPLIKLFLRSDQVKNLIVTYSIPEKYSEGHLAFDPNDWSYLPMFQKADAPPIAKVEHVIVGVGFVPYRLPELLQHDYEEARITLIFPFPPGPPQFFRNWNFVHQIEKTCQLRDERQIVRVHAHDPSGCYDHFSKITRNGKERAIFAPFGPKSHSIAMCLYAIKHDLDVYYTQPTHYHPQYSIGMRIYKGKPETHTYAIRLGGRDLYK